MESFIYMQFWFIRISGTLNIRFDQKRGKFVLWHWPTIIYCFVFNLICISSCPIFFWIYIYKAHKKFEQLSDILELLIPIAYLFDFIVALFELWLNRRSIHRVLENFYCIVRGLWHDIFAKDEQTQTDLAQTYRLLTINFTLFFIQGILMIYHQITTNNLSFTAERAKYFVPAIWRFVIWFVSTVLYTNIFGALLLGKTVLSTLVQRLRKTGREMNTVLDGEDNSGFLLRQQKLNQTLLVVARLQRLVKASIKDMSKNFRWHVLTALFHLVLKLVVTLARIIWIVATPGYAILTHVWQDAFMVLMTITGILLIFYVCQCIIDKANLFKQVAYEIRLQIMRPIPRPRYRELEQNLDLLMLEMQQEDFHVRVLGVVNLDLKTAFGIFKAMILHLLTVLQLILKFDYKRKPHP